MKKELFLEKIDLLTISLEAIFLNNKKQINALEIYYLSSDLRNKNYNKIQRFGLLIIYIYTISKTIRSKYIQKIAQNIIKNDKTIEKYILKFSYIYFRNKKFYSNYKSLSTKKFQDQNIHKFAILTIYIISEINNNKGIYKLLKFLNK